MKGGTAPLGASAVDVAAASILDGSTSVADSLLADLDAQDEDDRRLRDRLIRAAAATYVAGLRAEAKHALHPDLVKLSEKLAASHTKLLAAFEKALAKAEKQDVVYVGPTGESTTVAVTVVVESFVLLTQDGDA